MLTSIGAPVKVPPPVFSVQAEEGGQDGLRLMCEMFVAVMAPLETGGQHYSLHIGLVHSLAAPLKPGSLRI